MEFLFVAMKTYQSASLSTEFTPTWREKILLHVKTFRQLCKTFVYFHQPLLKDYLCSVELAVHQIIRGNSGNMTLVLYFHEGTAQDSHFLCKGNNM